MFKLGRGGGGGGGRGSGSGAKRPLPPAGPSIHRPGGARPPVAGRNSRPSSSGAAAASVGPSSGQSEAFTLESRGGPPDFAAIIRLTPDLVDEICRVEAQGGAARIKFDPNTNNSSGNVIDVGGKEFRFTWSGEVGDLCEIYEERQSGDDGNGLLVECGSVWRKLNVHRTLDESTKNHVKMRSEEAERISKSRKAIVLDPTNPSVKSQAKTMAAAALEGNMRRMSWKRKEFYKKRKVEPTLGITKSTTKYSTSIKNSSKVRPSLSPAASPSEQHASGSLNFTSRATTSPGEDALHDDVIAALSTNEEDEGNLEKEIPEVEVMTTGHDDMGDETSNADKRTDLRSMLVTILSENPKGMNLKNIQRAVAETFPNSGKTIENVIKSIANYQAPGRYTLKPEVHLRSSQSQASEPAGSSEKAQDYSLPVEADDVEKTSEKFEQQAQLNINADEESDRFERIHDAMNSPDHVIDDHKLNESEERVGSSSESASDSKSDSDSSDSGSDSESPSRSRSKSRSPAGSDSASSSDSDSDGSSSSKEGSDVEVDIMTSDDEKADVDLKTDADMKLLSSDEGGHDGDNMKQDRHVEQAPEKFDEYGKYEISGAVDTADDFHVNNINPVTGVLGTGMKATAISDLYPSSSLHNKEDVVGSPYQHKTMDSRKAPNNPRNSLNGSNQQVAKQNLTGKQTTLPGQKQSDTNEKRSKSTRKRVVDATNYIEERPENSKRPKGVSSSQAIASKNRNVPSEVIMEEVFGEDDQTDSTIDPPGKLVADLSGRRKSTSDMEKSHRLPKHNKSNKTSETFSGPPDVADASFEKSLSNRDRHSMPGNKRDRDMQGYNGYHRGQSIPGSDLLSDSDSYNRKPYDFTALKDAAQPSQIRKTDAKRHSPDDAKGRVLRRELSELEVGEFREPLAGEEALGVKKQIEKIDLFKSFENNSDVEINKGRSTEIRVSESKKQSPANSRGGISGNHDQTLKKKPETNKVESFPPQQKSSVYHSHQGIFGAHLDTEEKLHFGNPAEGHAQSDRAGSVMRLDNNVTLNKRPTALPHDDDKHGGQIKQKTVKAPKHARNSVDPRNGSVQIESHSNGSRRGFTSEDDLLLSKYDKQDPELKGPIKDYLQYKDYVEEYREKYSYYCTLNKNLENIRNDFLEVGNQLDVAKGRSSEEYYGALSRLKEMYRKHGERHKQMKKVFILLHEELKNLKQRIKDFVSSYSKE